MRIEKLYAVGGVHGTFLHTSTHFPTLHKGDHHRSLIRRFAGRKVL